MLFPKKMQKVIDWFSSLPGMGTRSAERIVTHLAQLPPESLKAFAQDILEMQHSVRRCVQCGNYAEKEHCDICRDSARDSSIVCVVEHIKDLSVFEKTSRFKGVYHILGGKLSPIEGIGPDQLNIKSITKRIEKGDVKELILATGADLEGEATADYLFELFSENRDVKITRIAFGIPYGSTLDHASSIAVEKALQNRIAVRKDQT